jgi:hypothetical protein
MRASGEFAIPTQWVKTAKRSLTKAGFFGLALV